MSSAAIHPLEQFALLCRVGECGLPLTLQAPERRMFGCARGHRFDLARHGALNLLNPNDKRSKSPGDSLAVVEARTRMHQRGVAQPLVERLQLELSTHFERRSSQSLLEIACGEGSVLDQLQRSLGCAALGADISSPAIERAAKRQRAAAWLVFNADRSWPIAAGSIDALLSINGRCQVGEAARVLADDGRLWLALPAPDDQCELRAALLGQASAEDRAAKALDEYQLRFELEGRTRVAHALALDPQAVQDALAMTYRGQRHAQAHKALALGALRVSFSWELLRWRRKPDAAAPKQADESRPVRRPRL